MALAHEVYQLDLPCGCGASLAIARPNGPHWEARCGTCDRHLKFVSKAELGIKPITAKVIHEGITKGQRLRLLLRANCRCELCGARIEEGNFHASHIVPVEYGVKQGLSPSEVNSDENLMALCAPCNQGMSKMVLPLRTMVMVLFARTQTD